MVRSHSGGSSPHVHCSPTVGEVTHHRRTCRVVCTSQDVRIKGYRTHAWGLMSTTDIPAGSYVAILFDGNPSAPAHYVFSETLEELQPVITQVYNS